MDPTTYYKAYLSPYYTLQKCFEKLQDIKALIDGLSEHRRRKILIAAQSGACHSLGDIELELDRLVDEYHSLSRLYEESSIFQRHIPCTRLQTDIAEFEDQVRDFYKDAWKTTAPGDRSINWRAIVKKNTA